MSTTSAHASDSAFTEWQNRLERTIDVEEETCEVDNLEIDSLTGWNSVSTRVFCGVFRSATSGVSGFSRPRIGGEMDNFTGIIPRTWKRVKRGRLRGAYERLNRRPGKGWLVKKERLGKRSWRFKLPKIRVKILSPITLLARLRDAYVRMMLNLAGRGSAPGLAYGFSPNVVKPAPARKKQFLTDAELLCLEYLKRDTSFLIQAAKAHAEVQAHARVALGM